MKTCLTLIAIFGIACGDIYGADGTGQGDPGNREDQGISVLGHNEYDEGADLNDRGAAELRRPAPFRKKPDQKHNEGVETNGLPDSELGGMRDPRGKNDPLSDGEADLIDDARALSEAFLVSEGASTVESQGNETLEFPDEALSQPQSQVDFHSQ